MLHKHYFAYRKFEFGKPTDIQIDIEVIVDGSVDAQTAKRIADAEIRALTVAQRIHAHQALRAWIQELESTMTRRGLTTYTFRGRN